MVGELTELVYHFHEPLELRDGCRCLHLSDCLCFLWVGLYSRLVDVVTQKLDRRFVEHALLDIDCGSILLDALENGKQSCVVLCLVLFEHHDIIHLADYTVEACQDSSHAFLKVFGCT